MPAARYDSREMDTGEPVSNHVLYQDIDRVAVDRRRIARRVRQLGGQIARAYHDGDLSILAILTGSMIFLADLVRQLPLRMRLEVISVSSYPGTSTRPGRIELREPISRALAGKHVLIVDDILDSGRTLGHLARKVRALGPLSLRTCVLLRKVRPDVHGRMEADFVGFDVEDAFLVGYGLDYDNLYRNLPDIGVLKAHAGNRKAVGCGQRAVGSNDKGDDTANGPRPTPHAPRAGPRAEGAGR